MSFSRRHLLHMGASFFPASLTFSPWLAFAQSSPPSEIPLVHMPSEGEMHGLSSFGELSLPADFPYFPYVNPHAPKGGILSVQIKNTAGNQNFETFDTLNIYTFKGDGAAGMDATFDSLMVGTGDEPDTLYGLVARAVRWSPDKRIYHFFLRKEARFHDGSPLTAQDVVFSLLTLKEKGHPVFKAMLRAMLAVEAENEESVQITFSLDRPRDLPLFVAGLPIFSHQWWKGREFEASTLEAPLGSGPYQLSRFEQGRFVEFERVKDYWAAKLPVNIGQNNFDRLRYSYYRDRTPAFEDFKAGRLNFNEEYTSKFWALAYDFPAVQEGRVKKDEILNGAPTTIQGWYLNTRRPQLADPRIREALNYAFDFEWTNKNIMFSTYQRLSSFFENTPMQAKGLPSPQEITLLDPFRSRLPLRVFDLPFIPPISDGSGADRLLLQKADALLKEAGCRREKGQLLLPNGQPLTLEFLDSNPALQPHTEPFQANLRKLGILCTSRLVDAAQYKRRLDAFDFDIVTMATGGTLTPGESLKLTFSSEAARMPGSRNMAGVAHDAVDALLETISLAKSRAELTLACSALDRVLRSGFYWIPMWYRQKSFLAYWDVFGRPAHPPTYSTGAPSLWWWEAAKAKALGMEG